MSDRKQALQELLENIEAGEFDPKSPRRVSWSSQQHRKFYDTAERGGIPVGACGDAARSYRGSLDAAKALHEAVLPGWLVHSIDQDSKKRWYISLTCYRYKRGFVHTGGADAARAWLCAIIKALIAEADT